MKNKYKLEIKPWDDLFQLILHIDQQSFKIGRDFETKKEALWYRKMLHKALERLISKKEGE